MFSHLTANAGSPLTPPTSMSGVRRATPAMRVAAARMSSSDTSEVDADDTSIKRLSIVGVMARYTLVYGIRLVPEGSLTGVEEGRLKLKSGEAGLTVHTIDGTVPQLRRALDRSLDAFFELLPGAEDEDRDD